MTRDCIRKGGIVAVPVEPERSSVATREVTRSRGKEHRWPPFTNTVSIGGEK